MKILNNHPVRSAVSFLSVALMAGSSVAFGQDSSAPAAPVQQQQQATSSSGGWTRVGDSGQSDQSQISQPSYPAYNPAPADQPGDPNQASPSQGPYTGEQPAYNGGQPGYNGPAYQQPANQHPAYSQQGPYNQQPNYRPQPNYGQQANYGQQQPNYYQPPPVPAQVNVPAGTFLTVRVNQMLSSDKNQPGDAFSATLVEPVVANGIVIAEPGQTIGGRVAEAKKAGRMEGVARLGVELTSLSLVDGQQIPIHSQLVSRKGDTSVGRDAGAIVGTTALGAAVGAAAGWGTGAAIGAGAGLVAGTVGVLLTRGHPSVIYPEQILTFRLDAPLAISTTNSPQAFRYVEPGEYDRPQQSYGPGPGAYAANRPVAAPYYGYGYGYPYYAYGWGYPYYWGPTVGFYFGRGYWGGHGFGYYGRGYYGRGGVGGAFARSGGRR